MEYVLTNNLRQRTCFENRMFQYFSMKLNVTEVEIDSEWLRRRIDEHWDIDEIAFDYGYEWYQWWHGR